MTNSKKPKYFKDIIEDEVKINDLKLYLIYLCMLIFVITFFILCLTFIVKLGDNIKTIYIMNGIANHVKDNNLELPLPNSDKIISDGFYLNGEEMYQTIFHLPPYEFLNILQTYYIYNSSYNCKYWTYVWSLYWKENRIKYNWKFEIINTPNHVFAVMYNDDFYCIADQDILKCTYINLNSVRFNEI